MCVAYPRLLRDSDEDIGVPVVKALDMRVGHERGSRRCFRGGLSKDSTYVAIVESTYRLLSKQRYPEGGSDLIFLSSALSRRLPSSLSHLLPKMYFAVLPKPCLSIHRFRRDTSSCVFFDASDIARARGRFLVDALATSVASVSRSSTLLAAVKARASERSSMYC